MRAEYSGQCHCGGVTFNVTLRDGFNQILRCNCSFCRQRGAVVVPVETDDFVLTSGPENLTLYQFHSRTAQHYFCKVCGIYTHHTRRSDPTKFGVNVAGLSGVSPFDFASVKVNDGQSHPSDTGRAAKVFGTLRFEKAID